MSKDTYIKRGSHQEDDDLDCDIDELIQNIDEIDLIEEGEARDGRDIEEKLSRIEASTQIPFTEEEKESLRKIARGELTYEEWRQSVAEKNNLSLFDDINEGLKDAFYHQRGKIKLRTKTVEIPENNELSKREILQAFDEEDFDVDIDEMEGEENQEFDIEMPVSQIENNLKFDGFPSLTKDGKEILRRVIRGELGCEDRIVSIIKRAKEKYQADLNK